MPDLPYYVMIPYSDLERYIKALHEIDDLKRANRLLNDRITALGGLYQDCLDCLANLKEYVEKNLD